MSQQHHGDTGGLGYATSHVAQSTYIAMQRALLQREVNPEGWPVRCPVNLQAPQEPLIDFLATGRGYDDNSVAAALREGTEAFQRKDFGHARDLFGVAYELGRLHHAYRPLLHDLLLRRILCHSMLGDFAKALQECEMAAWMIPNEATCCLLHGVVYSKLGRVDEANVSFQQAVALRRDFRNLVDCLVAFFTVSHGYCDRAVHICTQVLRRSPGHPFALLIRGDAYKFDPRAEEQHRQNAKKDYATLLDIDLAYQSLIPRHRPEPANHVRADELLLSFHPFLQMQGPKPYVHYALCRKRDPFTVASLVLLAVAKMRMLSRSGRLTRDVRHAYEDLLDQRTYLEQKVKRLVELQQRMTEPKASEVYLPVEPDHESIRKYRRYWMEVPPPSPKQAARAMSPRASLRASPPQTARPPCSEAQLLAQEAVDELTLPDAPTHKFVGPRSLGVPTRSFAGSPTGSPTHFSPPRSAPVSPTSSFSLPFASQQNIASPPLVSTTSLPKSFGPPQVTVPSPKVAQAAGFDEDTHSARSHSVFQDSFPVSPAYAPSSPPVFHVDGPPPPVPPKPPPRKEPPEFCPIGKDFSEKQWLEKAHELLQSFSGGISAIPTIPQKAPAFPPPPSHEVEAANTARDTVLRYRSSEGKLVEVSLMEAIDHHGLEVLPDWYSKLDRVYQVHEMIHCSALVDPPVPLAGLLGAPGHSYVVSPKLGRSRAGDGSMREDSVMPDEETVHRHGGRLLATSLTRPPPATAVHGAAVAAPVLR
eukprot:TRINITY_DN6276_c0_g1_i2.p1 TRINITY_DN6276_c0_g1~~TRINITY_DN6276_c0_g1_i2.p1  ORF type:complete len:758 (+),score=115.69 TRINITY_DN6276_c0_g1_i2:56-2329(+)